MSYRGKVTINLYSQKKATKDKCMAKDADLIDQTDLKKALEKTLNSIREAFGNTNQEQSKKNGLKMLGMIIDKMRDSAGLLEAEWVQPQK